MAMCLTSYESAQGNRNGAHSPPMMEDDTTSSKETEYIFCSNKSKEAATVLSDLAGNKTNLVKRLASIERNVQQAVTTARPIEANPFDYRFHNVIGNRVNIMNPVHFMDVSPGPKFAMGTDVFLKTNFYDYNNKFSNIAQHDLDVVYCIGNDGKRRYPVGVRPFHRFQRNTEKKAGEKESLIDTATTALVSDDFVNGTKMVGLGKLVNKDWLDSWYTNFMENVENITPNVGGNAKGQLKEGGSEETKQAYLQNLYSQQPKESANNVTGFGKHNFIPIFNINRTYDSHPKGLVDTINTAYVDDESNILSHMTKEESCLAKNKKNVEDFVLESELSSGKHSGNMEFYNMNESRHSNNSVLKSPKNSPNISKSLGFHKIVSIRNPDIIKHLHKIDMSILSYPPAFNYGSSDINVAKSNPPSVVSVHSKSYRRSVTDGEESDWNSTRPQNKMRLVKFNKAKKLDPNYMFRKTLLNGDDVDSNRSPDDEPQKAKHWPILKRPLPDYSEHELSAEDEIAICTAKVVELQIFDSDVGDLKAEPSFTEATTVADSGSLKGGGGKLFRVALTRNRSVPLRDAVEMLSRFNNKYRYHQKDVFNKKKVDVY